MSKTIGTILTLKDKMSPKLIKVSSNVKNMSKDMQRASKQAANMANKFTSSVNKMVGKAAKASAALAGLAAVAVIKVGFDGLKELDEGVAKIKSIAGDIDAAQVRGGLIRASNQTGVSTGDLADAQYSAISSGVSKENSLDAAVASAKLAKAGFTDADAALKILTSTMNVYGLEGTEAMTAISDKLLVTQNLGVTSVAELADSMGSLTPIASSAGTSIDELMAGMASLTKNGLKTDEAVTSMKGIMTSVIKPTSEAQKAAKSLGIDFSVAAIESKGFAGFLEEVKQKTGGNLETMGKLFGNVRALSGALILTGDGIEDFNVSLDAMRDSAGMTEQAYETMQNTIGAKLGKLKNVARNTATSIMDTQSGAIGSLLDKANKWVEENQETIKGWVDAIGDGIAKAIKFIKAAFDTVRKYQDVIIFVGAFVVTIAALTKAVAILKGVFALAQVAVAIFSGTLAISPIGWAIGAIAALVAVGVLLWKNWDKVKDAMGRLKDGFDKLGDKIIAFKDNAVNVVKKKFEDFTESLKENQDKIEAVAAVLGVVFGPALLVTGTKAVIAGAKIAAHFMASIAKAGTSAVVSAIKITGSFIVSMTKAGAGAIVAGAKIVAGFIGSMVKAAAQAIVTAAVITAQLIVAMANYAISGWKAVLAIGATVAAWAIQKGAMILSAAATGIMTGAQWALNAAMSANPIALVISGLALLGVAIALVVKHWKGIVTWIEKAWNWLTRWNGTKMHNKNGTVTTEYIEKNPTSALSMGRNALGTSYWRGGLTHINERGGEIVDLPNGSRVIPADKSDRLMRGGGNSVTININGVNKSANEIMSELVPQLKLAMANI